MCGLRTKKGVKGWAGWAPESEAAVTKLFYVMRKTTRDCLVFLHERLADAAAAVKTTSIASRNRVKFSVPDEIRDVPSMASEAAKCRNPVKKKRAAQDRS